MIDLAFQHNPETGRYDLVLSGHAVDPVIARGTDEIDQRLVARLRTRRGEWYLDPRIGLPLRERFLTKSPDWAILEQTLRAELRSDPDVLAVREVVATMDKRQRKLTLRFTAVTTDGEVNTEVAM